MNIFSKTMQKLLPQIGGGGDPMAGSKDAKIAAGHNKIQLFMARGIKKIDPPPAKDRRGIRHCQNHMPKVKAKHRWFFRVGDLGYAGQPAKPVPYSRAAMAKAKRR